MGEPAASLRLISYNIQAGTSTSNYRDYVVRGWRHVLPHDGKITNLDAVARLLAPYDIAGLQELDDGSLRSGFLNQTQYLAERARFPFWSHQANRRVSKLARTCNGLLSRLRPSGVEDHKLPGRMPGRGALAVHYGVGASPLVVVVAHLALTRRSRVMQLDYLGELVASHEHAILLGDFNTTDRSPELRRFVATTGLTIATAGLDTFPSWRPQRAIDHVLLSPTLTVRRCEVLPVGLSDHRPVALEVELPVACAVRREERRREHHR